MFLRGGVLILPPSTYDAAPKLYKNFDFIDETLQGAILFGLAAIHAAAWYAAIYCKSHKRTTVCHRALWLRYQLCRVWGIMFVGFAYAMFRGDWLVPSWAWFLGASMLATASHFRLWSLLQEHKIVLAQRHSFRSMNHEQLRGVVSKFKEANAVPRLHAK
jgi:drug/metabolite transporter (DMT)-like permease